MDPSTTQNWARNSFISGITTPFKFINIDPNYPSTKNSNQYQYSNIFLIIQLIFNVQT